MLHSLALATSIYLLGVWRGPGPFKDVKDRAQKSLAAKLLSIHGGGRQGAGGPGPAASLSAGVHGGRRGAVVLAALPPAFPQPRLAGRSAPVAEPTEPTLPVSPRFEGSEVPRCGLP